MTAKPTTVAMIKRILRNYTWKLKKEEIRRLLTSGSVSKNLEARLNIFSAAKVVPEHVWKPSCNQCSKCNVCMEQGGQTYVERCQTQGFKAHLWRVPHKDETYHYEVEYLVDPLAEALPCNYMASYQRHLQLRKSFSGLEVESQIGLFRLDPVTR